MAKNDTGTAKGKAAPKYSEEFITKAFNLWDKTGGRHKAKEVAKMIGCHESMLYYWKSKKDGKPWGKAKKTLTRKRPKLAAKIVRTPARRPDDTHTHTHTPTGVSRSIVRAEFIANDSPEVAALKREIANLQEEVEILTKTVMFFARRRA